MQLRNIALCLLLPIAARADETQKNNISIKAAVCTENIALDMYKDSKGNPLQEILHIENVFKAKGLVPVWVTITNTTDSAQQVINQSSNSTQKNKKLFINYYKRSPILRTGSMLLMLAALCNGFLYSDFARDYQKVAATSKMTVWMNLFFKDKVSIFSKNPSYVNKFIGLNLFSGLVAFGGWWLLTGSNKRLEAALNKLMLQDQLVIEPGQTVKKLIILGTEKKFTLNVVDMSTNQAIQKFEYECGDRLLVQKNR